MAYTTSLEVIDNYINKLIQNTNGIYNVYEDHEYTIICTTTNEDFTRQIFIEDYPVAPNHIKIEGEKIIIQRHRIFESNFGLADLKINNTSFLFNIRTSKLNAKEIEELILYLFDNNHLLISTFLSGNKSAIEKKQLFSHPLPFSSKYIYFLNHLCDIFEQQYPIFVKCPYTVIRKKEVIVDYEDKPLDYKIDWLLRNLDELISDDRFEDCINTVNLNGQYAFIDKIAIDKNEISYNTYENRIILGGLLYFKKTLIEIQKEIQLKLKSSIVSQTYSIESDFVDIKDLRALPYIKLKEDISKIERRLFKIIKQYQTLLEEVEPLPEYPRLTCVSNSYRHYQKLFIEIRALYETKYSMDGMMNLLSIRKLNELYELFNLCVLIQCFEEFFVKSNIEKEVGVRKDSNIINKLLYRNKVNASEFTLFYEPVIKNCPQKTNLISIGNYLDTKNYRPDFVIEYKDQNELIYCILDAKYSKSSTVKQYHLTDCSKKYIIDIGVFEFRYKKIDYLVILNPEKGENDFQINFNSQYCPQIGTISVKPRKLEEIKKFISDFITINSYQIE